MAFKISYGNGALGDVSEVLQNINSYAPVTAVETNSVTIDTANKLDGLATFATGAKVLIHVSATTSSSYKTYLGRYLLANVTDVNGDILTLDEDPTTVIPSSELARYYVQAIAVAQFQNLTLSTGTSVTPPVYSVTSYYGGIVALMCSETLTFDGGHISLADRGIPPASKSIRPTSSNHDVAADTDSKSGNENSETQKFFMLNSGDGAAFIVAKKLVCHEDSRIGNVSTRGYQFFRGASSSVTYNETAPSDVTNVGGSTILIAAETIQNFTPKIIAKYRTKASTAGQGICRCYIASNTILRNDEGLYAFDRISNPSRIKDMQIKNFGNGNFGDLNNVTTQLNNYATVTAIDGVKVTYKNSTTAGLAPISAGALVMIHFNHKGNTNVEHAGRFILANVLSDNGSTLTLDRTPPDISVTDYACQIVSIPQANNFTLGASGSVKTNSTTPAFDGAQGGICAIAAKNTCDISYGKIDVTKKGGGKAYAREGLAFIGNAQDANKLPIGQGHGSIFILAQNLKMSTTTRLGHTNSGSGNYGYKGSSTSDASSYKKYPGSGAAGGTTGGAYNGGYGSNGKKGSSDYDTSFRQGAHVMIVADTITGFCLDAICTGGGSTYAGRGMRGEDTSNSFYGGYNGGGGTNVKIFSGGSAGWAFIYCNNAVDPVYTNINFDN